MALVSSVAMGDTHRTSKLASITLGTEKCSGGYGERFP